MKRLLYTFVIVAVTASLFVRPSSAKSGSEMVKERERNTISLELEFSKRNPNALQRFASLLNWGPNGYATGFAVGEHLVMTAYHVVSGDLDESKKLALGFGRGDALEVKVYTNGCQAKVLGVDQDADLALLEVCGALRQTTLIWKPKEQEKRAESSNRCRCWSPLWADSYIRDKEKLAGFTTITVNMLCLKLMHEKSI